MSQLQAFLSQTLYPQYLAQFSTWIEKDAAWKTADEGFPVRTIDHRYDMPGDASGLLLATGDFIASDSKLTLLEFAALPSGEFYATYASGSGFAYPSILSQWEMLFNETWETIVHECLTQAVQSGHFLTELTELLHTYSETGSLIDEEVLSNLSFELAENGQLDFFAYPYETTAEDLTKLAVFRTNPTIAELSSKHRFAVLQFTRKLTRYMDAQANAQRKLEAEYQALSCHPKAPRKLTNTPLDRQYLMMLERKIGRTGVALAVHFGDLALSLKAALPYEQEVYAHFETLIGQENPRYSSYNPLPSYETLCPDAPFLPALATKSA